MGITWNIPVMCSALDHRANVDDSLKNAMIRCPSWYNFPSLSQISSALPSSGGTVPVVGKSTSYTFTMCPPEGISRVPFRLFFFTPKFASDGRIVWGVLRWGRVGNHRGQRNRCYKPGMTGEEYTQGVPPWVSSRGYKVTDDGWVLSPAQKRILFLPHHWREDNHWNGRVVGLAHCKLLARGSIFGVFHGYPRISSFSCFPCNRFLSFASQISCIFLTRLSSRRISNPPSTPGCSKAHYRKRHFVCCQIYEYFWAHSPTEPHLLLGLKIFESLLRYSAWACSHRQSH